MSQSFNKLKSGDINVRIKGVRSLGHISKTSDKYRLKILNALSSFVKTQAPWKPGVIRNSIEEDVQLALEIIGQLPKKDDRGNLIRVNMHNVDISGAKLASSDFEGAILWGSNLRHVVLARSNLREADLGGVDFTDASLEMADLEGAFLWMSSPMEPVRPCMFDRTRLAGANLKNAHLEAANLALCHV